MTDEPDCHVMSYTELSTAMEVISSEVLYREEVMAHSKRTHGECFYCGDYATTRDHVVPVLRGGSQFPENLVPCCSDCNQLKSHLSLEMFRFRFMSRWFGENGKNVVTFAGEYKE